MIIVQPAVWLLSTPVVSLTAAFSNSIEHGAGIITNMELQRSEILIEDFGIPLSKLPRSGMLKHIIGVVDIVVNFESDDKNYRTYKSATQEVRYSSNADW